LGQTFNEFKLTQALEPYEINFKDYIAYDKEHNRKQCGWFALLIFLGILLIKGAYGLLLPKAT
jgi:hypothetical protein